MVKRLLVELLGADGKLNSITLLLHLCLDATISKTLKKCFAVMSAVHGIRNDSAEVMVSMQSLHRILHFLLGHETGEYIIGLPQLQVLFGEYKAQPESGVTLDEFCNSATGRLILSQEQIKRLLVTKQIL